MQEKIVCPICKQLGFKSFVYEIDWKSHFQKLFGGYYDENGNYIESNTIPPPLSKTFWCTYGHSWIQTWDNYYLRESKRKDFGLFPYLSFFTFSLEFFGDWLGIGKLYYNKSEL